MKTFAQTAVSTVAATIGGMSIVAIAYGATYTADCRTFVKNRDELTSCYFQGGTIMGLGTTAGSGAGLYMAGYNTLNPNLRSQKDKPQDPDKIE